VVVIATLLVYCCNKVVTTLLLLGNFCYKVATNLSLPCCRDGIIHWYIAISWYIKTVIQYRYKFKSHQYIKYRDVSTYQYQYIQYCIHIYCIHWLMLGSELIIIYYSYQLYNWTILENKVRLCPSVKTY